MKAHSFFIEREQIPVEDLEGDLAKRQAASDIRTKVMPKIHSSLGFSITGQFTHCSRFTFGPRFAPGPPGLR